MRKRFAFASFVCASLLVAITAAAQGESCPAVVIDALDVASQSCADLGRNQVCYGNVVLEGEPKAGVDEFTLAAPGDMVDAALVQRLQLSPLDDQENTWGIALMKLQANLPATLPGQNVTFLLFGDVEITDASDDEATPLEAFYFRSGLNDALCVEAPDSGLLIQTPQGAAEVAFSVNEVTITLGSRVYLQAQAGGDMTVSVLEGQATLEADGVTVTVVGGEVARIPLDANLAASGPPTEPEPLELTELTALPISLLELSVSLDAEATAEATDDASSNGGGGGAIAPTPGTWVWETGAATSEENCPPGTADFTAQMALTPAGPFVLPNEPFGIVMFFNAAFALEGMLPGATLSNPEPNLYVADNTDAFGGRALYEVRVISEAVIEGTLSITEGPCSFTIPFRVTLAE
jgi:hypothetical protein